MNTNFLHTFTSKYQQYGKQTQPAIIFITLSCISILAFLIRVFSVIRYESVIHEFDPWFNYRTTQFVVKNGVYSFWNWFDPDAWYPLGRVIGGTTYPGIMFTSTFIYRIAELLYFPLDIRNICVFLAPVFAAFTSIVGYFFVKEVSGRSDAGLLSSLFIAIVPGYISRSVAGSYDNEAVAIFALLVTFYFYIKSVNEGSLLYSLICSFCYLYMVSAWGGYVFIMNLIPLYNLFLIIIGRLTYKIYISYTVFYIIGTMFSMQIPFVMFNAIETSEHMLGHAVFIVMQVLIFIDFIKDNLPQSLFKSLYNIFIYGLVISLVFAFLVLSFLGKINFQSRSLTLLDPTYASKFIPLVASVSEHQPTTWSAFFNDLHLLLTWCPLGLYFCYFNPTNSRIFISLFGVASIYFSCIMIRLLLISSPAFCLLAGIGLSDLIRYFISQMKELPIETNKSIDTNNSMNYIEKFNKNRKNKTPFLLVLLFISIISFFITTFIYHCVWVSAESYASPSIVLAGRRSDGSKLIIDDFREAYYWLRKNTKPDAKIVSWWDYGYQISGMSNRAVIVDNNTWNNTHIATVGATLAYDEEESFKICKKLDADYILIIFGGYASNTSSDDIAKFLWMVRIASGNYPKIKEEYFIGPMGYRVDASGSDTMLNSMIYKLSYYRFDEQKSPINNEYGYDAVRSTVMGKKNIKLRHFSESFTTYSWIVRIYKVNDYPNRELGIKSRFRNRKYYISNNHNDNRIRLGNS